ncbi:IS110 family transposase [Streptomyces sp. NPDC004008]
MPEIWAGVDIGKTHHHAVVINTDGERLLSRRVHNDESELLELIGDVLAISTDVLWAVDLNHGGAALLIGLLLGHGQPMAYLTGLAVHRASATYRGEGKTDERDAFVIADQARVRRDLGLLRPGDEVAVDLRTLTTRRLDAVFDRTRQINRLRAQLLHRGLLRAMYLSAMASLPVCPASKAYYRRKRSEGKGHKQALLALARRRLNVLWAMIRDGECYHASPPVTAAA